VLQFLFALPFASQAFSQDSLPSWNETAAKKNTITFIEKSIQSWHKDGLETSVEQIDERQCGWDEPKIDQSDQSNLTDLKTKTKGRNVMGKIRKSGGYRGLAPFQTSTLVYDATYWFCERFIDSRSRTVDQMVQAARSGRQNIAEGSRAAATSSQTELRLVNVARASLEELLLDYEDFLRHRKLELWAPDCAEASAVRSVPRRFRDDPSDQTNSTDLIPNCPQCDKPMALRTAKQGKNAGQQFWGCTGYPDCKGTSQV